MSKAKKNRLVYFPAGLKPNRAHVLRVWRRVMLMTLSTFIVMAWLSPILSRLRGPSRYVNYEDLLNWWVWLGLGVMYLVVALSTLVAILIKYQSRKRAWDSERVQRSSRNRGG